MDLAARSPVIDPYFSSAEALTDPDRITSHAPTLLLPMADRQSAVYTLVCLRTGTLPWAHAAAAVLGHHADGSYFHANIGPDMQACLEGAPKGMRLGWRGTDGLQCLSRACIWRSAHCLLSYLVLHCQQFSRCVHSARRAGDACPALPCSRHYAAPTPIFGT